MWKQVNKHRKNALDFDAVHQQFHFPELAFVLGHWLGVQSMLQEVLLAEANLRPVLKLERAQSAKRAKQSL